MTLEELVTEKRVLGNEIERLIQQFEKKYSCHAEIRQDSRRVMGSQVPRTFVVEIEAKL